MQLVAQYYFGFFVIKNSLQSPEKRAVSAFFVSIFS